MPNRTTVALAFAATAAVLGGGCKQLEDLMGKAGSAVGASSSPTGPKVTDGTGPKIVPGPGTLPECFTPWSKDTKFLQWAAREPPYRIALESLSGEKLPTFRQADSTFVLGEPG